MARRPQDERVLHGHRVITGSDLRAAFEDPDGDEALENPVRMRRRILHGVVLVVLAGIVTAAIVVAMAIMNGQIKIPTAERSPTPTPACPAATFDYAPPESVIVNVYNSTSRPGLAQSVADELAARKFNVGVVANGSSGHPGAALVISGAAGQAAAFSVQRNVPGSDYVQDNRTGASVDVILAGAFKELAPAEDIDRSPGLLQCPRETRRDVETGPPPSDILPPPAVPATPAG